MVFSTLLEKGYIDFCFEKPAFCQIKLFNFFLRLITRFYITWTKLVWFLIRKDPVRRYTGWVFNLYIYINRRLLRSKETLFLYHSFRFGLNEKIWPSRYWILITELFSNTSYISKTSKISVWKKQIAITFKSFQLWFFIEK